MAVYISESVLRFLEPRLNIGIWEWVFEKKNCVKSYSYIYTFENHPKNRQLSISHLS
jgi:hypothetical protein